MPANNPQLAAVALLVRRFGNRIGKGGFEVEVSFEELAGMPPHGLFQEVPDPLKRTVKWQYFPNDTVDVEGRVVPDGEAAAPALPPSEEETE